MEKSRVNVVAYTLYMSLHAEWHIQPVSLGFSYWTALISLNSVVMILNTIPSCMQYNICSACNLCNCHSVELSNSVVWNRCDTVTTSSDRLCHSEFKSIIRDSGVFGKRVLRYGKRGKN